MLNEILRNKRYEVAEAKRRVPYNTLPRPSDLPPTRSLREALLSPDGGLRIIAEIKKASPSRGVIRTDFDPLWLAGTYASHGAAALSVLTDARYFQGRLDDIERIRQRVPLPILRKDFIIDRYQVRESRARKADAVLLIVGVLARAELRDLYGEAQEAGLSVLVEVHTEEELDAAIDLDAEIIGINNRDLHTFEVSLETTKRLAPKIPLGRIGVCESGLFTRGDLQEVARSGIRCFLIGEALMKAQDPGARLAELLEGEGAST
jgi:indole-3-glycerol phosphate synthase